MPVNYSLIAGENGAIAKSGKTIYDSLNENQDFYLPITELEAVLRSGLVGLDLKPFPNRSRSKVLKSKICEVLGYPIPKSFKRSKPRFSGQDFDTYSLKANNLQIYNEKVVPTRRYVLIKLNESFKVIALRVVTGEVLSKLDTTGTLTKKYQASSRETITRSVLVSKSDSYSVLKAITALANGNLTINQGSSGSATVDFSSFLQIDRLYERLLKLVGTRLSDPGVDQERNRGAALHRAVCRALGAQAGDTGSFPDVIEQLLELKLQTARTVDLGLISPDDTSPLEFLPQVKHCDVRYGVFYATIIGDEVHIDHLVLTRGADFFSFFQRFEGKIVNAKLQIPLPRDFFE